jgi:predicted PurR-regulated permease PerM
VVPRYLKGLLIVCFILVGLNSLGFYLIGIEYALLFGVIAALFNLIPYLGTVLGYGVVLLFVLGTQSPSLAIAVIIQFLIVQFIENNILTPNIIVCENVESLKPVGFLLGTRGTERHSLTIDSLQRRFGWHEDE